MTYKTVVMKRCKLCQKPLRAFNKTGYCSSCSSLQLRKLLKNYPDRITIK